MGDALIWQGSEDFITSTGHQILSRTSFKSFTFPKIRREDVIILNGGGSFGDIWRIIMDFFLKVIQTYPENRILLFPQSVFYENPTLMADDAKILAKHKDLHLIARDTYSFEIFSKNFPANNVYLAPDMAFAINPERLKKWYTFSGKDNMTLYLRRIDKEWVNETEISLPEAVTSDWPTISSPTFFERIYNAAVQRSMYHLPHNLLINATYWKALDWSARKLILKKYLERASSFLAPFYQIITTRLHVLILGVLLEKNIEYIDNSSKKLSAFVDTWLSDFSNISHYEPA
ncbi:MAG: polysaccharide pyruvyl transferase family protein [Muribaculaceae bacterium]|nr:polysaccharide pyruvyl transferase family protein [Muribaculaceae bacterium]